MTLRHPALPADRAAQRHHLCESRLPAKQPDRHSAPPPARTLKLASLTYALIGACCPLGIPSVALDGAQVLVDHINARGLEKVRAGAGPAATAARARRCTACRSHTSLPIPPQLNPPARPSAAHCP